MASTDFTVKILGDADGANRAVDQFGDKLASTFNSDIFKGSFLGSFLGNAFTGVLDKAADVVGDFVGDSTQQASDLAETMSKSSVVFGDSAGAIEAFGSNAAKNIGLSKEAAMSAAAGFGDMFTQLGFTQDAAAAMSQQVLLASADLGSFSNLETADVADRISAAFRGEYDSLQAVIPNINAARVESEALAMTGKTTADSLTEQEKAAAVLAIVQKDGAKAMGDFARTSDGAANKSKIAAAALQDQQAVLGEKLLPIYTEFQSFLITNVVPAISAVVDFLSQNSWVFAVLGGVILAVLVPAMVAWAASIWATTVALLANPVTWIILAIIALIAAIVLLVMNWDTVVAWITQVWSGFISWITGVINGFVGWWNGIWAAVGAWISSVWSGIVTAVTGYFNMLKLGLMVIGSAISGWWNGLWSGIGSFFGGIWAGILGAIQNVQNAFSIVFNAIGSIVRNAFNGVVSVVRGVINGIIDAVNGVIGGINGVAGAIGGALGVNISIGKIPRLATGGVTSGPMFAIVGDNPGGREYIEPVDDVAARLERVAIAAARSAAPTSVAGGMVRLHPDDIRALAGEIYPLIVKGSQKTFADAIGG
ncbi:hypothetical protein JNB63_02155 [Microbacterium trichothecenolyticum]|uniref:phage tail protein n=1 Tax=Microbacterium trichothecenolyticum TaxID=69370 RepID=UPI001C6DE621|nr:hypothetical protein [Microbacterium trichothecenolyticum]MBW9118889.1 hypothetical protein [Microbacterium trichothecenolyticum]